MVVGSICCLIWVSNDYCNYLNFHTVVLKAWCWLHSKCKVSKTEFHTTRHHLPTQPACLCWKDHELFFLILDQMLPKVLYNIPHIRQRYHWDCGIACILMLLSEEDRKKFLKFFSQICAEEGFGQNTWTIDLCYLLRR